MVKMARTASRNAPEPTSFVTRRAQDICGLILFFLGAGSLLCLALPQQAFVPRHVDDLLRLLAGTGAYAVPLLLMFAGTMFLIGYERLSFSETSCGTALLFLDFLAFRHLRLMQNLEALHLPPRDLPGQIQAQIPLYGGWVGWMFGATLHSLLGFTLSYLALLLALLIGIVLIVDQPLIEILRRLHAQSAPGFMPPRRLRNSGDQEKEKRRGGEEEANGRATAISQSPVTNHQSSRMRAVRAARVAERALTPGGRSVPPADAITPAVKTLPLKTSIRQQTPNRPTCST